VSRFSTLLKQTQAIFATSETEPYASRPLNTDIKNRMLHDLCCNEISVSTYSYIEKCLNHVH
jgi:hypothetical protein